jgi:hypothetical protein
MRLCVDQTKLLRVAVLRDQSRFLVLLITENNDYQMEQAASAKLVATQVRAGHTVATVVIPPNAAAIAFMTRSIQMQTPPAEQVFTSAEPFPSLECMKPLQIRITG